MNMANSKQMETLLVVAGLAFVGFMVAKRLQQDGGPVNDLLDGLSAPLHGIFQSDDSSSKDRMETAMKRFALQAGASWEQIQQVFADDTAKGGAMESFSNGDGVTDMKGPSGIFANAGGPEGASYTVIDDEPYWNVGNGR
ncbi:hypothetical protein VI06_11575 [Aquitalea magnusonii]|nr:hypothetical protein VI06_11575 [Aquitalea magnusonii]